MSAPYPPTAAATEASRILDMGRQRAPSPTMSRMMSRADIREFRLLFGDATLDPLGSSDARPLSRVLNSAFQEKAVVCRGSNGPARNDIWSTDPPDYGLV